MADRRRGSAGIAAVIPTGVDDDSPAVPSRHGLRRQAIHDFLVAERKTWMPTCVGMTVCGGPACQPFRGLVLHGSEVKPRMTWRRTIGHRAERTNPFPCNPCYSGLL